MRAMLKHADHYGLKFIFIHDPYYEPLVVFAGWSESRASIGRDHVWSKDDVPPARTIPSDAIPSAWEGLIWGILPIGDQHYSQFCSRCFYLTGVCFGSAEQPIGYATALSKPAELGKGHGLMNRLLAVRNFRCHSRASWRLRGFTSGGVARERMQSAQSSGGSGAAHAIDRSKPNWDAAYARLANRSRSGQGSIRSRFSGSNGSLLTYAHLKASMYGDCTRTVMKLPSAQNCTIQQRLDRWIHFAI